MICEDAWNLSIMKDKILEDVDFLISINASPFEKDKDKKRREFFSKISSKYKFNLIYLNAIGGQDEIVFDGSSFMVNKEGLVIHSCKNIF